MNDPKVAEIPKFGNAAQSLNFLQNHVKGQLLDRIQTGDPIYDTIVAFVVLSGQDVILRYMSALKTVIVRFPYRFIAFCKWLIRKYRERNSPSPDDRVVKEATVKYITDGREVNTLFEPVMWYINSLTDTKKEATVSMETTKNNAEVTQRIPKERAAKIEFLDHEITYQVRNEMITIYAEREHKRENTIITLNTKTAKDRPVDIFQQFAEMCTKKYQEFNEKKKWEQRIYRNEHGAWKSQKSKTSRKLETVVLKNGQMPDIMADINDFIHKEEWYVSRDVPYTRRYMFWGVPGTGKSSCIKAIACYTKRHIHYLVLSEVESDTELFRLMEQINFQETILVIEDIDCASDVTHERINAPEEDEQKDKEVDQDEHNEPSSRLTLSGLLNAIDGGMVENHGQIMVVTTNHPEKLDAALTRPGRVDRKYEFGKCDTYQIEGLFYNFFERSPSHKYEFPIDVCSPADVTSIFLQYKKDPDEAWEQAITKFGKMLQSS